MLYPFYVVWEARLVPKMQNNRDGDVAPTMIACWLINDIFSSTVPAFLSYQGLAECNLQGKQSRIAACQNGQRIRCIN